MDGEKNFDISNLSLKELIEVYESINAFLDFLDENEIKDGESNND